MKSESSEFRVRLTNDRQGLYCYCRRMRACLCLSRCLVSCSSVQRHQRLEILLLSSCPAHTQHSFFGFSVRSDASAATSLVGLDVCNIDPTDKDFTSTHIFFINCCVKRELKCWWCETSGLVYRSDVICVCVCFSANVRTISSLKHIDRVQM